MGQKVLHSHWFIKITFQRIFFKESPRRHIEAQDSNEGRSVGGGRRFGEETSWENFQNWCRASCSWASRLSGKFRWAAHTRQSPTWTGVCLSVKPLTGALTNHDNCSHDNQGDQHPSRRHLHPHHARPGKFVSWCNISCSNTTLSNISCCNISWGNIWYIFYIYLLLQ